MLVPSANRNMLRRGEWGRGPPLPFFLQTKRTIPLAALPAFAESSRGAYGGARFSKNNHARCRGSAAPEHKAGGAPPTRFSEVRMGTLIRKTRVAFACQAPQRFGRVQEAFSA